MAFDKGHGKDFHTYLSGINMHRVWQNARPPLSA